MKKFIISIDAGTTSNRSILLTQMVDQFFFSKEFTQYFPKSGWVEHNPDEEDYIKHFKKSNSKQNI